jgi:iron complex outermembrane receptor protein
MLILFQELWLAKLIFYNHLILTTNQKNVMMKFRQMLLMAFLFVVGSSSLWAQGNRTVSGVVTDENGKPVPWATVSLKENASSGVYTDDDGKYSINVSGSNPTLIFSALGFNSVEKAVVAGTTVDVTMNSSAIDLQEVVVTGLGIKRDKKSVGFAVQQLKSDEIAKAVPMDVSQGLMGKVAGLNISTSNGLTNASSRIVIRGNNSLFGNNQPIIVVDGAILDNKPLPQSSTDNSLSGYQDWGNYLSYMNMETVENISVLKGPNAAALYGARGANGVILITTKKGANKKGLGIDYSFSNTFTNAFRFLEVQNEYGGGFSGALTTANQKLPKTKSGQTYVPTLYPASWVGNNLATEGSGIESAHGPIPGGQNTWDQFSWFGAGSSWGPRLDGTPALWWDGTIRPYDPQPDNRSYMFQQGTQATHNLSFASSSDVGSMRISASLSNTTQPVPNVNSNNLNFGLGSNLKISNIFSAELSAAYNQTNRLNSPEIGTNNSWSKFMIYGMSREYKPLEKDFYKNADGSKYQFPGNYPHAEYSKDLFWSVFEKNQRLYRDEFLTTIKLNAEITPWLNAFVRTSADLIGMRFETTRTTANVDKVSEGGFAKRIQKDKTFNTDVMVTAHKDNIFIDGLKTSISGMYNNYSTNSAGVFGENNSKFAVPGVYSLSNFTNRLDVTFGESRYDVKSNALLGILNLNYKDYLFLDLTGRNDINSTLPIKNNSYFYPSVNAAFVFTEGLNLTSNTLSYGKLRLAYGKSANATEPYQLDATYDVGAFGGQSTNSVSPNIPPQNLRFQTSASAEVGLNLGFFDDKVNLDLTYYNILSENQILSAATPASSGATGITFNSGKLRNKGIEVILKATPVNSNSLIWSTTLNLAKNNNFIEELAPGVREQWLGDVFGTLGAVMKVAPGQKYGAIYGTDFLLDAQGRKQIKNVLDPTTKAVIGTEYLITNEQVVIGNAAPKFTGGFGNTLRYKNFNLYGLIDFKVGGDIYSVDHATAAGSGLLVETLKERNGGGLPYTYPDGTKANHGVVLEGYNVDDKKENDRVVHYLYKWGNQYAGWSHLNRPRSLSIFENTWVKLREIALTYDLPKSVIGNIKAFQGLSVSLVGRNLAYLYTSLPDKLNPEAINGTGNAQGLQWSAFPSFRTVGFTVNARF